MAKVLAIVTFKIFPPHMGGQKGVGLFYRYLGRHHQLFMAVSADNTEPAETDYHVWPVLFANKKMVWNIFRLFRLKNGINCENIDCIIAEHSYSGWMAYLLKKATGKPFILHSHNLEFSRFRHMGRKWWKWYWHYEKWIHQKADFNFFISQEDYSVAAESFSLSTEKCSVIPYGVEETTVISQAKHRLKKQLGITTEYIFYFNGTLDYEPNIDAVRIIIDKLDPLLRKQELSYTIFISGKRLSSDLQSNISQISSIKYLDFVEDVALLYQGADLFINPVLSDSGVKTKVIEALANNCTVVSTTSGAAGIPVETYHTKMLLADDNQWEEFIKRIVQALQEPARQTPEVFFKYFSWTNIAARASEKINRLCTVHE